MEPNKDHHNPDLNNSESDNTDHYSENYNAETASDKDAEDADYVSPDKYLAMEQKGVSFTHDTNPTHNSDYVEFGQDDAASDQWEADKKNSRNSEAFNQDDYLLTDNIDLDEDQSQSISSEDEIDTNTTDEI